ncbi:MAG: aminopeptidase [Deltaproteobacteria bacterium]|nr:aminopeptidase [Deltaproteobacteria bacterium]MBW2446476.1 aminopeptidase [Deltaproteobacteria bacterium]
MGLLCLATLGQSGCYYVHLASGQLRILRASRGIDAVLSDPATEPELRGQLERVLEARAFAADLGLDVGEQYTSYVAWPDDRIVTTVVATRPGEIEPAGFDFPIVGNVPYKGFFERERAEAEATRLRKRGLDVCVLAVPAYSTLGWLADPVTDPMLRHGEHYLVETLIHELVHATVFFADAAEFNEGLASFIGQEGAVRFYAERGLGELLRAEVADDRVVQEALLSLREEVGQLYAASEAGDARDRRRAGLEAKGRARLAALPLQHADAQFLSERARLNDACLSIAATYATDLPAYAKRLAAMEGDLVAFIELARSVEASDDPRAAILGASYGTSSAAKAAAVSTKEGRESMASE